LKKKGKLTKSRGDPRTDRPGGITKKKKSGLTSPEEATAPQAEKKNDF